MADVTGTNHNDNLFLSGDGRSLDARGGDASSFPSAYAPMKLWRDRPLCSP
jgi:hypothetical protein